ncbi:MAG: hypothetical protein ABSH09_22510 [Bryobacteraceae bacterium]|jgi:hypothetical protein
MPITTPLHNPNLILQEIGKLGDLLSRSIASHRYDFAQECSARLLALHSDETHAPILSILERARRIALIQRSAASSRLSDLARASRYLERA